MREEKIVVGTYPELIQYLAEMKNLLEEKKFVILYGDYTSQLNKINKKMETKYGRIYFLYKEKEDSMSMGINIPVEITAKNECGGDCCNCGSEQEEGDENITG